MFSNLNQKRTYDTRHKEDVRSTRVAPVPNAGAQRLCPTLVLGAAVQRTVDEATHEATPLSVLETRPSIRGQFHAS